VVGRSGPHVRLVLLHLSNELFDVVHVGRWGRVFGVDGEVAEDGRQSGGGVDSRPSPLQEIDPPIFVADRLSGKRACCEAFGPREDAADQCPRPGLGLGPKLLFCPGIQLDQGVSDIGRDLRGVARIIEKTAAGIAFTLEPECLGDVEVHVFYANPPVVEFLDGEPGLDHGPTDGGDDRPNVVIFDLHLEWLGAVGAAGTENEPGTGEARECGGCKAAADPVATRQHELVSVQHGSWMRRGTGVPNSLRGAIRLEHSTAAKTEALDGVRIRADCR